MVPGETIEFKVDVNSAVAHNFHIGRATDLSQAARAQRPARHPAVRERHTDVHVDRPGDVPADSQFACTVPGHYQSGMHVDLIAQCRGRRLRVTRRVGCSGWVGRTC